MQRLDMARAPGNLSTGNAGSVEADLLVEGGLGNSTGYFRSV
jgi:hypothetical protein